MTIRHLRIFIEVARTGNMSEAAGKFFLSQPTVSQVIKELEEHYGVLLFERRPRKLFITEEGRKLLNLATHVVDEFNNAESTMMENRSFEKIRIGATITVGNTVINRVINDFKKLRPNTGTFVCISNTQEIEQKLLNAELDIGIIEGEVKSPELISIPSVDDYLVLICSMEHPFAGRDLIYTDELEREDFHFREQGSGTRELFENYLKKTGMKVNCSFESNCPNAIKKSVMENNELAVISVRLVEEEARNGKLKIIKPAGREWERSFSLVYYKDKVINENIRAVKEVLDSVKKEKISKLPKAAVLKRRNI